MKCPACKIYLHEARFQNVPIDVCYQCEGSFFDSGELSRILQTREDILHKGDEKPTGFVCPRCLGAMEEVRYSDELDVFLHRCTKCRGLWAEKGEVGAIGKFFHKYFLRLSPGVPEVISIRNRLFEGFTRLAGVKSPVSLDDLTVQNSFMRKTFLWMSISLFLITLAKYLQPDVPLIYSGAVIILTLLLSLLVKRIPVIFQGILLLLFSLSLGIAMGPYGHAYFIIFMAIPVICGLIFLAVSLSDFRKDLPSYSEFHLFQTFLWGGLAVLLLYLAAPAIRDLLWPPLILLGMVCYLSMGIVAAKYRYEKGEYLRAALAAWLDPLLLFAYSLIIWSRPESPAETRTAPVE